MKIFGFAWLLTSMTALAIVITGCGGSGSAGGASADSDGMRVFASDDPNTGYDHVWVTLDKIDLTGASGTKNIYDSTADGGKVVDLRTLRDATGAKFLLLGGGQTPAGTFTGIRVTVASQLTLVPAGKSAGVMATFAKAPSGAPCVLSLTFATPQTISATNEVVVDFDVAHWTLDGSTISAPNNEYLAQAVTSGLSDRSRHVESAYSGTVSGLTGTMPHQSFTVTRGTSTINVATGAGSTIMNADGSSNATLANGSNIELVGVFDPADKAVNAMAVTVCPGTAKPSPAKVAGLLTAVDVKGGTLTLEVQDVSGFQPGSTSLTVGLASGTTLFGESGVTDTPSQFFADLVPKTTRIFADGVVKGSILTASHVGFAGIAVAVDGEKATQHEAAIRGATANASATAGTFDLTLANWEGGPFQTGGVIHVVTSSATQFSGDGSPQTQAGFFTALTGTAQVQARGKFDPTTMTLTATQVSTGQNNQFHF